MYIKNIFITGAGSSLRLALAKEYPGNGGKICLLTGTGCQKLISVFDKLLEYESGSFVDVRAMSEIKKTNR